jgi:histidine triad (HIT) family protein
MMIFAKKIAVAMKKTVPCRRIALTVIGLEVPHAHIHLIPINKESDMSFSNPKLTFTPEEFQFIADHIKSAL